VIPTRNRLDQLARCLHGIADNQNRHSIELIVIDDGSAPPVDKGVFPAGLEHAIVARRGGEGPAAARNAGAALARGDVVLFTDDDTVPAPTWIDAAVDYLDDHPRAVGVTGPIRSDAWDPLYEQSMLADGPGHQWTCNIAYRLSDFRSVGGFRAELFPHAHAEDRDLAIRALARGPIGFSADMDIEHTPRAITLRNVVRQGRWVRDDLTLYALHPQLTEEFGLPTRLAVVAGSGLPWIRLAARGSSAPLVRRWVRAISFCAVAIATTSWAVLRAPRIDSLRAAATDLPPTAGEADASAM
jgi:GT2 family glycosyltransferase